MAKYIEADKLIKTALKHKESVFAGTSNGFVKAVASMTELTPAADVQEVRHGHWESPYKRDFRVLDNSGGFAYGKVIAWICSECASGSIGKGLYCSNCGARMEDER